MDIVILNAMKDPVYITWILRSVSLHSEWQYTFSLVMYKMRFLWWLLVFTFLLSFFPIFAQSNSRGQYGNSADEVLNSIVNKANQQYDIQDSPLEKVNQRQWWYPIQYKIVNTLDSIRVNIAIYIQWIVFIGLALATIGLIYIGFLMVTNAVSNEWTIEKIKTRVIGIVVGVLLITGFYAVLRLLTSLITALFGTPGGDSGFQ